MCKFRVAYLWALLLFISPANDACAVSATPQPPPLADEDDEYLSVERDQDLHRSTQQKPVQGGLKPTPIRLFTTSPSRRDTYGTHISRPFGPEPVYMFMSLQR
jgi:hypothetical protein